MHGEIFIVTVHVLAKILNKVVFQISTYTNTNDSNSLVVKTHIRERDSSCSTPTFSIPPCRNYRMEILNTSHIMQ